MPPRSSHPRLARQSLLGAPNRPERVASSTLQGVETAIARPLTLAAEAGRFGVVAHLAKELEARRLARDPGIVDLESARRRRGS
jgi:hypothetical protein